MILFGSNELPQEIKDLIDAANNGDVVDRILLLYMEFTCIVMNCI